MFVRQSARRGLASGLYIVASALVGGVHPLLFLRLVRGVIVPLLFYAAPCWAAVLGVETRLIELDRVMALASLMAFGLERSTSIEASLVLGGLGLPRVHIMRALVRFVQVSTHGVVPYPFPLYPSFLCHPNGAR